MSQAFARSSRPAPQTLDPRNELLLGLSESSQKRLELHHGEVSRIEPIHPGSADDSGGDEPIALESRQRFLDSIKSLSEDS